MIVVDSSILVGIKLEEDSKGLLDVLAADECAIGTPTLVEARI